MELQEQFEGLLRTICELPDIVRMASEIADVIEREAQTLIEAEVSPERE